MLFEMRLEGGYRMFWSAITPTDCGRLQIMRAPGFCLVEDFPGYCGKGARGIWDLWPIDNPARPHPLYEVDRLCRPFQITARTPRIALISFQHADDQNRELVSVELFLSATEPGQNGRSALEDWVEMLRTVKDDPNKEAALRLNVGIITPEEIAGFRSQKKLVATDLTLEVRPCADQADS